MGEIHHKVKTAIEFLKDGLPFKIGELYLGISEGNILNVTGTSQYIHLENVTKQGAIKELEEVKSIFKKMISISTELKNFISDKKLKFNIDFDYGMGDVRICSELDGTLKWEMEVR